MRMRSEIPLPSSRLPKSSSSDESFLPPPSSLEQFQNGYENEHGNMHALVDDHRSLFGRDVVKVSDTECTLTTFLHTEYSGWDSASGIMFTVQPRSETIELLTIEFQAFGNNNAFNMAQVYYREGSFSGVLNDPSEWRLVADTDVELIRPPSALEKNAIGGIIPSHKFEPITFKAGETYSIYISTPLFDHGIVSGMGNGLLRVSPNDDLIGDVSMENESLQVMTGVSLEGEPFPSTFKKPANFNGVLHYRLRKSCDHSSMFTTTTMDLAFSLYGLPTQDAIQSLTKALDESLSELLWTNEFLRRYSDEGMLEVEGMIPNIRERNGEKCSTYFDDCGLISVTVNFKHSMALDPGTLEAEILAKSSEDLDAMVASIMAPIRSKLISEKLSKGEFVITLVGVPSGEIMSDSLQKYFSEVTKTFLEDHSGTKIFFVDTKEQISIVEDRKRSLISLPFATWPRMESSFLRRRMLSDFTGSLQVITEIIGEGSNQEIRRLVLEGIGNNSSDYVHELISQQMRPRGVDQDYGEFFADLTGAQVKAQTFGSPTLGGQDGNFPIRLGGSADGSSQSAARGFPWVIVCILLIVGSLFWIFFRIYMDCFYAPHHEPMRLNKSTETKNDTKDPKTSALKRIIPLGFEKSLHSEKTQSPEDSSDEETCLPKKTQPTNASFSDQYSMQNSDATSARKKPLPLHQSLVGRAQDLAKNPLSLFGPSATTVGEPHRKRSKSLDRPLRLKREDMHSLHEKRTNSKSSLESRSLSSHDQHKEWKGLPSKPSRSVYHSSNKQHVAPKRSKSFDELICSKRGSSHDSSRRGEKSLRETSLHRRSVERKKPPRRSVSLDDAINSRGARQLKSLQCDGNRDERKKTPTRSSSFCGQIEARRKQGYPKRSKSEYEAGICRNSPQISTGKWAERKRREKNECNSIPSKVSSPKPLSRNDHDIETRSKDSRVPINHYEWDDSSFEMSLGGNHSDSDSDEDARNEELSSSLSSFSSVDSPTNGKRSKHPGKRSPRSVSSDLKPLTTTPRNKFDQTSTKNEEGLSQLNSGSTIQSYEDDRSSKKRNKTPRRSKSLPMKVLEEPSSKKELPKLKVKQSNNNGVVLDNSGRSQENAVTKEPPKRFKSLCLKKKEIDMVNPTSTNSLGTYRSNKSLESLKIKIPNKSQPKRNKSMPLEKVKHNDRKARNFDDMNKSSGHSKSPKNHVKHPPKRNKSLPIERIEGGDLGGVSSMHSSSTSSRKKRTPSKHPPKRNKSLPLETMKHDSLKAGGSNHSAKKRLPAKKPPKRNKSLPKIKPNHLDSYASSQTGSSGSVEKNLQNHMYAKKIDKASSHSDSKAELSAPIKRGVRATKSLPLDGKKAMQKPKVVVWHGKAHDSDVESDSESDSESESSDYGEVLKFEPDDKSEISVLTTATPRNHDLPKEILSPKLGQTIFERAHRKNFET